MASVESKQTSRITVGEIKLNFNGVEDERRRGVDSILGDVKLKKKKKSAAGRADSDKNRHVHTHGRART